MLYYYFAMLDFLVPKNRIQYYDLREIPIETFEIMGISQINPYCKSRSDKEFFVTVVNIANDSKYLISGKGKLFSITIFLMFINSGIIISSNCCIEASPSILFFYY